MNFRKEFSKGYEAYKNKEFIKAREIFENLANYKESYFSALRMLINIDIKQNNFREAREKIEKHMYYDNVNTLRLLSKIDMTEYNYESAIQYSLKIIEKFDYDVMSLYHLANCYIMNGKFMEAREVLRNIPQKDRIVLSDFYYVTMDIIYGNYERALSRLNKLDKNKFSKPSCILYDKAFALVNYYLGKDINEVSLLTSQGQNFISYLYSDDVVNLLEDRYKWYCQRQEKFSDLKFRDDINFKELVEEIQYKITKVNPRYYNFMSNYSIILDEVVGYNKDRPLNGVQVNTPLGINKIAGIIVSDFSSEFDSEHLSTDRDLRKRLLVK